MSTKTSLLRFIQPTEKCDGFPISKLAVNVDWMTVTGQLYDEYYLAARKFPLPEVRFGQKERYRKVYKYRLYNCKEEGFSLGQSDNKYMLEMRSEAARRWREMVVHPDAWKCTRLDICLDIVLDRHRVRLADLLYFEKAYPVRTLTKSETGSTLYIGKRGGEQMLRIYDKGGEQGQQQLEWWRIELQLGKVKADTVFQHIANYEGKDEKRALMGVIVDYLEQKKILFDYNFNVKDAIAPPEVVRVSDLDRRIEWAERSVAGLRKLADEVGEKKLMKQLKIDLYPEQSAFFTEGEEKE